MFSACVLHAFLTCFLDVSKVSSDRGCFTESTLVFSKDSKGIGVAHNEVGDDAAGAVVTFQHSEPQLQSPQKMPYVRHLFCELIPRGAARCPFQNACSSLPPFQLGLTPDFVSAFCTVYPRRIVLPVSWGAVHSRVALEPQTSTSLILRGGPGLSER